MIPLILMTRNRSDLLGPFTYGTFAVKTVVVFLAIATALDQLANYNAALDKWQEAIKKEKLALLVLFLTFTFVHLMYELLLRELRYRLERGRSSPGTPRRRANAKKPRKR